MRYHRRLFPYDDIPESPDLAVDAAMRYPRNAVERLRHLQPPTRQVLSMVLSTRKSRISL